LQTACSALYPCVGSNLQFESFFWLYKGKNSAGVKMGVAKKKSATASHAQPVEEVLRHHKNQATLESRSSTKQKDPFTKGFQIKIYSLVLEEPQKEKK